MGNSSNSFPFGLLFLGLIGLGIYMIPGIIAMYKNHKSKVGIVLLNFFLGWTVIVWVLCLLWSINYHKTIHVIIDK